ncbi:thioredoxin [Sulfuracidifex tepidarius]|uniref:Thioredoxin n=1 Tax=Sulfuracidifex tepidarius TaxID=1294262 RepID=A0A510E2F4_9CREN|nr:thioredoxin [Sulfuracidifex tepidarius]BBG23930.1 Thioredoxin [Sulfuracidifex tepidarius]BBG26685.1 Thioredoxin [Sulfuracidifex tepidarius]
MSEVDKLVKEVSERLSSLANSIKEVPSELQQVEDENIDEVLKNNRVVVLDFWATWCAPCHLYEPVFKKVASKYKEKAFFGRVNVDENNKTADKYNIMNIPTTLIFVNGGLEDTLVGAIDEETLEKAITKYLQ